MDTTDKKKILIIEDERPMATALELKLNHSGYIAQSVHNGEDGLELVNKEKFDLILLDIVMPKMDGFAFLENLKEKAEKPPVIMLSNLSQEEDEIKAKELGAIDFFIKSNTPISEIVTHVEKVLGK